MITGINTGVTSVLKSKKLTPNSKNPIAVITNDRLINISTLLIIVDFTSISAFCLRFGLMANRAIDMTGNIATANTAYKYESIGVFMYEPRVVFTNIISATIMINNNIECNTDNLFE
jgi:hypothetical protein